VQQVATAAAAALFMS